MRGRWKEWGGQTGGGERVRGTQAETKVVETSPC